MQREEIIRRIYWVLAQLDEADVKEVIAEFEKEKAAPAGPRNGHVETTDKA